MKLRLEELLERVKKLLLGKKRQQETEEKAAGKGLVTKPCPSCGRLILYDPSRKYVPNYCAECSTKYRTERGMITRTCRICGKTFTLPENVQCWPDCCPECKAKQTKG